jgi:hypothetical protein
MQPDGNGNLFDHFLLLVHTSQLNTLNRQCHAWLRRLVTGLSIHRPGFAFGWVHVGFMVKRVALGQDFLRFLQFYLVNIIPPGLHTHIYYVGGQTIGPLEATVQRYNLISTTTFMFIFTFYSTSYNSCNTIKYYI